MIVPSILFSDAGCQDKLHKLHIISKNTRMCSPTSAWAWGGEWYHLRGQRVTDIFGKLFTLSERIYVIAFAKVSSSMIFQGGGVSKSFAPILHFQLIMNF